VLASARPGALILMLSHPERVFKGTNYAANYAANYPANYPANYAAFLERLAGDPEFMASRLSAPFLSRILYLACSTGSERLLEAIEAVEALEAGGASPEPFPYHAEKLCRENCPHLAERVGALRMVQRCTTGLLRLVEYGLQDIDRSRVSLFATNYNVLRIMSGLGGLTYSS
jgi:hypothetical protein